MTDVYIKIEMVGDDRHFDGSLMDRIKTVISEFGTVVQSQHKTSGAIQSYEAYATLPNPVGIFGDRDVMADYRLDG